MAFTFRQKFRCFPQSVHVISSALKLRGKCAQSTAAASRREGLPRSPSAARGEPGAALLKEVGPTLPMLQVGQSATRKALPTTRYGRKTHQQVLLFFFFGHAVRMRDLSSRCLVPPMLLAHPACSAAHPCPGLAPYHLHCCPLTPGICRSPSTGPLHTGSRNPHCSWQTTSPPPPPNQPPFFLRV